MRMLAPGWCTNQRSIYVVFDIFRRECGKLCGMLMCISIVCQMEMLTSVRAISHLHYPPMRCSRRISFACGQTEMRSLWVQKLSPNPAIFNGKVSFCGLILLSYSLFVPFSSRKEPHWYPGCAIHYPLSIIGPYSVHEIIYCVSQCKWYPFHGDPVSMLCLKLISAFLYIFLFWFNEIIRQDFNSLCMVNSSVKYSAQHRIARG